MEKAELEVENAELEVENAIEVLQGAIKSKTREMERLAIECVERNMPKLEDVVETRIYKMIQDGKLVRPEEVEASVKKHLNNQRTKTLVIKNEDRKPMEFNLAHENLPDLLKLVNTRGTSGQRLNIYMYGQAGSGKSTAARQVAEALGLQYGYASLNPMTPDSRALGYMHAGGDFVGTEFFRLYTQGGVFCFDEIDNASASFVTTLNSALENGHGSFPHGVFPRHPDFVCICTANTIGRGGDIHYPERRALDSAFLERFVFLEWAYDQKLTKAIVGGILGTECDAHFTWVDERASYYRARFPELVISPRAYIQSALLLANGFSKAFAEQATIARGIGNA